MSDLTRAVNDLRDRGLSQREIGERLGIARVTVWRCMNPEAAERERKRNNDRRRGKRVRTPRAVSTDYGIPWYEIDRRIKQLVERVPDRRVAPVTVRRVDPAELRERA